MIRYIIGLLVTVGLIILILVLIFSGNGTSKQSQTPVNLMNYSQSATARAQLTIEGPINADQSHGSIEIDVSQSQTALTVYRGYQRTIVRTRSYPNNPQSFANFMYALQRAYFTKGDNDTSLGDERGYCVQGSRSVYTFNDGSKNLFRYWSTSCGQGTFHGDINTTNYLFEAQIPDFSDLTDGQNYL